jgi:hypothetical protein
MKLYHAAEVSEDLHGAMDRRRKGGMENRVRLLAFGTKGTKDDVRYPVAIGVKRTLRGSAKIDANDPEQSLDVWPHLRYWTAVRAIASCGWSRYAALV